MCVLRSHSNAYVLKHGRPFIYVCIYPEYSHSVKVKVVKAQVGHGHFALDPNYDKAIT